MFGIVLSRASTFRWIFVMQTPPPCCRWSVTHFRSFQLQIGSGLPPFGPILPRGNCCRRSFCHHHNRTFVSRCHQASDQQLDFHEHWQTERPSHQQNSIDENSYWRQVCSAQKEINKWYHFTKKSCFYKPTMIQMNDIGNYTCSYGHTW